VNKIILLIALLLAGCGQRSTIKNDIQARTLAEAYGDGRYVISPSAFVLEDPSLAFRSGIPGIAPIAGGMIKILGDIFAKTTSLGKVQLSYVRTIPEISPEYIHSIRLRRFFFYMKPQKGNRRFRDFFTRLILGKGNVTFGFLDKFALKLRTTSVSNPDTHIPEILDRKKGDPEFQSMVDIFKKRTDIFRQVIDPEKAKELILLKYDKKNKFQYTQNDKYGQMHIIETSNPLKTRDLLRDHPKMFGYFERIHIMEKSLIIELRKDPVVEEGFRVILSELADELDELGVTYIDTCTIDSCLELKVADVNFVPILIKGNAIKLDALIEADKLPESFKLQGFVEFEVKWDPKI